MRMLLPEDLQFYIRKTVSNRARLFGMKVSLLLLLLPAVSVYAQSSMYLGVSGIADNMKFPGLSVNVDYEKKISSDFSLPIKAEVDYVVRNEVNSFAVELKKGFRRHFSSGLFLEQYIAVGYMANFYKVESEWYFDKYAWGYRYAPGANWGFKPSTGMVIGYDLGKPGEEKGRLFLNPDVYWNLGFRPLHLPYCSVQAGYSFNLKSSSK